MCSRQSYATTLPHFTKTHHTAARQLIGITWTRKRIGSRLITRDRAFDQFELKSVGLDVLYPKVLQELAEGIVEPLVVPFTKL